MNGSVVVFMQAVAATAACINGVYFWSFWRESRDQLFALFACAFWLLAASWTLLGLTNPSDETRPYIYAVRLVAFLLIIAGIVQKNRQR